jgi:hypothetical protein
VPSTTLSFIGGLTQLTDSASTRHGIYFLLQKKSPESHVTRCRALGSRPLAARPFTVMKLLVLVDSNCSLKNSGHKTPLLQFDLAIASRDRHGHYQNQLDSDEGPNSAPTKFSSSRLNLMMTGSEPWVRPKPAPILYSIPCGSSPRMTGKM